MKFSLALSACLSTLILCSAAAKADEMTDNVRCFIVFSNMASGTDPGVKTAGTIGSMYWVGRIDGKDPTIDLQSLILAEMQKMTGVVLHTEAKRCGEILVVRGKALTAIGQNISEVERKQAQPQDSK